MMRRGVWLFGVLLLAGCGAGRPSGDSQAAVCRRQAYDDPTVKHLAIENLGVPDFDPQLQFDYEKALRAATDACLRQHGLPVQGGVEPVRPY